MLFLFTMSIDGLTALLVEDNEELRLILSDALSAHGVSVLEAGTGEEGVEILESHDGEIQFLITDWMMPKMNGATVAATAKRLRSDIHILVMTGYSKSAIGQMAPEIDRSYKQLHKPFQIDLLIEELNLLVGKKS